ncbi:hypothetical protein E2C01_022390 [Portunus trituberculatus]|uniref:Uncharacterized protein n=1 Tax=Portunus trituberculatus TaxID=210409 RepID=A0A5B7E586_PORTR|nr:hypothetical protein [Portunus trituberculatus]
MIPNNYCCPCHSSLLGISSTSTTTITITTISTIYYPHHHHPIHHYIQYHQLIQNLVGNSANQYHNQCFDGEISNKIIDQQTVINAAAKINGDSAMGPEEVHIEHISSLLMFLFQKSYIVDALLTAIMDQLGRLCPTKINLSLRLRK